MKGQDRKARCWWTYVLFCFMHWSAPKKDIPVPLVIGIIMAEACHDFLLFGWTSSLVFECYSIKANYIAPEYVHSFAKNLLVNCTPLLVHV